MRDKDIRKILLCSLDLEYGKDPNTLIIEELGLCQGKARIDLAVINGVIHGYEIKSERDTLKRLPLQKEIYNKTLDYVTLVTTTNHLDKVEASIPKWWGINLVGKMGKDQNLKIIRNGKENPNVDLHSLVQLLWRDEALDILRGQNLHHGFANKARDLIWKQLVSNLSINELKKIIRNKLKARKNWRVD